MIGPMRTRGERATGLPGNLRGSLSDPLDHFDQPTPRGQVARADRGPDFGRQHSRPSGAQRPPHRDARRVDTQRARREESLSRKKEDTTGRGSVRSLILGHPGARFWRGIRFWPATPKSRRRANPGGADAPPVSRRSEKRRDKSAVEMPPHGKRGKLQNRLFHASHQAWKPGKKHRRRISTFPPRRLRDLSISLGRRKEKP